MTHHVDLDTLVLNEGNHGSREDGMCLMEAVAWFADEPHSDAPQCVSKLLRKFGIAVNDNFSDEKRQQLKPLIPLMVGTASDGLDKARSYLALDWLIRTWTPAWLDLAGLTAEVTALRDLRRIVDAVTARSAGPVVLAARDKAAAARDARAAAGAAAGATAWDAAGDAARVAAGDAAGDAAWAAAGDAAWDAAWAAAGDAARVAAWAAAGDAARVAARDAAGDAARTAAWAAARDAAWAAAWDALAPTVDMLQNSAIDLFQRMIRPEQVT